MWRKLLRPSPVEPKSTGYKVVPPREPGATRIDATGIVHQLNAADAVSKTFRALHKLNWRNDGSWKQTNIRVQKQYVIAASETGALIAGRRKSAVGLVADKLRPKL